MHAPHVERVVPMHVFLKLHTAEAEGRGNQPDERGGPGPDVTRGRRHGGQAADGAHAGPDQLWLSQVVPLDRDPCHHGKAGGQGRVYHRPAISPVGGRPSPAVEADPSQEEHASAQGNQRAVMRHLCHLALFLCFELARPHDEDGGQRRKARRDVHHDAPGKVHHPPLREEALGVPDPVDEGAVDERHPKNYEEKVGRKQYTVSKSTSYERGRNDCKHHLITRKQ
mmetsp:Transcript_85966/g.229411  ORF Transcript_85966/g.229411 Transcript_85966/m.229411 type:complete len:225 (+) Transcript_85966:1040-1714(+)